MLPTYLWSVRPYILSDEEKSGIEMLVLVKLVGPFFGAKQKKVEEDILSIFDEIDSVLMAWISARMFGLVFEDLNFLISLFRSKLARFLIAF